MAHNIQTMAYYGAPPWHGLGTRVDKRAISAEMIEAAGLDWMVEKRPARGATIDQKGRAKRYEIVRMPREGTKEKEVLFGVVSGRYEPLQNNKAFEFFDPIVGDNQACFETAGALGDGSRIWALARMPGAIEVVRGDECMKYLLLSNTHDGKGAVTIKFTPIRVVCQNTLMLAMEDGQSAFRVRHTRTMEERLEEVATILATIREVYERSAEIFRRFVKVQLNKKLIETYLENVFPRTEKQRKGKLFPERWADVMEILDTSADLQIEGVHGTLWALYNAIAMFEDYKLVRNKEETPGERLNRTWFGNSAHIKLAAFRNGKELVASLAA